MPHSANSSTARARAGSAAPRAGSGAGRAPVHCRSMVGSPDPQARLWLALAAGSGFAAGVALALRRPEVVIDRARDRAGRARGRLAALERMGDRIAALPRRSVRPARTT